MTATIRMRSCSVDGCGGKHAAKGYCNKHWLRLKRRGTLVDPPKPSTVKATAARRKQLSAGYAPGVDMIILPPLDPAVLTQAARCVRRMDAGDLLAMLGLDEVAA